MDLTHTFCNLKGFYLAEALLKRNKVGFPVNVEMFWLVVVLRGRGASVVVQQRGGESAGAESPDAFVV